MSADLFDSDARENAVKLISRFVNWADQHKESDTLDIGWFLTECRDFLADPYMEPWSNIEVEKVKKKKVDGSLSVAGASRQGEG